MIELFSKVDWTFTIVVSALLTVLVKIINEDKDINENN
jgi:hypothetical protein